jgi:hypothetical protein
MKTLIASVAALLVGLGIGWYIGHRDYDRHTTNEAVALAVQGAESSDALTAALWARAIQFIESGQTQQAVQLLSGPVAHYYALYGDTVSNDERSMKLRALIQELASSNQVVSARIAEASNAAKIK